MCEKLGQDFARNRERLLKSKITSKITKAPGNDGKLYKMLCIPVQAIPEFEKLVRSAKKYKKKSRS